MGVAGEDSDERHDEIRQGWYRDPFGIHEMRYFSAGTPTKLVRDGGRESYDEPPEHAPSGPVRRDPRRPARSPVRTVPPKAWAVIECSATQHVLVTDHLLLRSYTPGDRNAVLATVDEVVAYWQGYPWRRRAMAVLADAAVASPTYYERLVITDRASGATIGLRTIAEAADDHSGCVVGSWLGPGFRGRGLGTEELAAILAYCQGHLGFEVVAAGTEETNIASRRQHEANGMREFRRSKQRLPNGRSVQGVWYQHRDAQATNNCLRRRAPANRDAVDRR